MTYFREVLRRHYEHLEREHAKLSEEEAARTHVEGQNAAYLADLVELMPQHASSHRLWPTGWDITCVDPRRGALDKLVAEAQAMGQYE